MKTNITRTRRTVSMINTPDESQSNDWSFPVEQAELLTPNGIPSGIFGVIRQDTGKVVGEYRGIKLLRNADAIATLEKQFALAGIGFNRTSALVTKGGSRFFATYSLEAFMALSEAYSMEFRLQNSYDGTLVPVGNLGIKRMTCLNGAFGFAFGLASNIGKHSVDYQLDSLANDILANIGKARKEITGSLERLASIKLDTIKTQNILRNLVQIGASKGIAPKVAQLIWHNWQHPKEDETNLGDNAYRLLQAVTRYTRDLENAVRFESSRRVNSFLVGALDLSARQDKLKNLMRQPTIDIDFNLIVS